MDKKKLEEKLKKASAPRMKEILKKGLMDKNITSVELNGETLIIMNQEGLKSLIGNIVEMTMLGIHSFFEVMGAEK